MMAGLAGDQAENHNLSDLDGMVDGTITLGGESRQCRLVQGAAMPAIPPPERGAVLIKWVTVTHAVFNGGWRPRWICPDTGRVMLKKGDIERRQGENREDWRTRVKGMPTIGACLVSAVVSKPVFFSGWDASRPSAASPATGAPKPTLLAAPAGSVFFFRADSPADGDALVRALHGRHQSDFLGEKGLGLGFCGTWEGAPDVR